jgi:glutaminyl-peptide cyclotransferase
MFKYKLFSFIVLGTVLYSCGDTKNDEKLFSIDTSSLKQAYNPSESIDLKLKNEQNKSIDSTIFYLNDKKIGKALKNEALKYSLENEKLGYTKLKALVYAEGNNSEAETNFTIYNKDAPQPLKYKIVNTFPHDIKAYTQGYEFYKDTLLEGTGNGAGIGTGKKGVTSIRKTDYRTGKVIKEVDLPEQIFGEGITVLNNKLYQLTYRNNEAYVYNVNTFEKEKTLPYFKQTEGWGLTNDGTYLYMSDGSEKIYKLDPETFKMIDYINVYTNSNKIEEVNELEWIDGKIWANIYQKEAIAIINPKTGAIENIINFGELKSKVTNHPDIDAFNGIAYNPITKTIFVTGKNWDKSFEIAIEE